MQNMYLFGEAGAGKDTVSYYMAKHHGYESYALGDGPKSEYQRWLGDKPTKSDRAKVIEVAETYKQLYGSDVWCKETAAFADTFSGVWKCPILISDGRFLAEFDYFVNQRGYFPVYLYADPDIRHKRLVERDGVDQREAIGSNEDEIRDMRYKAKFVLLNNRGLDVLCNQIDELVGVLAHGT